MKRGVLGLTEKVTLFGKRKKTLIARIDSGATKSSLDKALAKRLKLVPKAGTKTIKSSHGISRRKFVEIKIRLNKKILKGDFTIADRAHMTYQVLIGQNLLKRGKFLIDPLKP